MDVSDKARKAFPTKDARELEKLLIGELKAKRFNDALLKAAAFAEKKLVKGSRDF